MTLSKITPSILLAGAMVLTSACERTQSKTADRVADKLPTDPIATLVQKYPNIHELLQLVDNADQTAQYFTDAEKAYLKAGIDKSIAGTKADMKARLLTFADRINTGEITAKQLEDILRSGVLSFSLPVHLEYPINDIDALLDGYGTDVTNASMDGETLVISRPGRGLKFSITIK